MSTCSYRLCSSISSNICTTSNRCSTSNNNNNSSSSNINSTSFNRSSSNNNNNTNAPSCNHHSGCNSDSNSSFSSSGKHPCSCRASNAVDVAGTTVDTVHSHPLHQNSQTQGVMTVTTVIRVRRKTDRAKTEYKKNGRQR